MKKTDAPLESMVASLERMQKAGADFFIDGEKVPLSEAVTRAVCEDCSYMADYVFDRTGAVEQVRFDKVDLF